MLTFFLRNMPKKIFKNRRKHNEKKIQALYVGRYGELSKYQNIYNDIAFF